MDQNSSDSLKDPLDPKYVSGKLLSNKLRVDKILEPLKQHFDDNKGYVAWSGGRDSTVVVHLANLVCPGIPVVWFDSGLEFPDTQPYIEKLSDEWNINLYIIPSIPDALTILKNTGTWNHDSIVDNDVDNLHEVLITIPSIKAHTLFGLGEVNGLRAEESVGRRMLLAKNKGNYTRKDGSIVYCPIWAWSSSQVNSYLFSQAIPINPVYFKLAKVGAPERAQRVGLTVDGNNPDFGRYTYLRLAYPDLWTTLCDTLPRLKEWR